MTHLYEVTSGDLIVNITFAWEGAIALVKPDDEGALVSHRFPTYVFRKDRVDPNYFKYTIVTKRFVHALANISPGGAGRNRVMSKKDFIKLKVLLPPIPEQHKIAEILGTWDEAIRLTADLIAAKQQRKKGLMQRLLTGEVRFPGFEGRPWREVLFGQVTSFLKGYSYSSSDYSEHPTSKNFITLKCVGKGGGFQISGMKYLIGDVPTNFHVKEGDLIFANTDLTRDAEVVGAPILVPQLPGAFSAISMDLTKVETKGSLEIMFLYYLMQISTVRNYMRARASGSTVLHLDVNACKKLPLLIPDSLEEQRKIATLFQACDREIDLLQQKLAALQQQKKGLMQRLLTGEVRVTL